MHARLVGDRGQRAPVVVAPDLEVGGVVERVGDEQHARPVDGGDAADLEVGRRDRVALHEQPAGAAAVGAGDQRAVAAEPRHAGHELDPLLVLVLEADVGGAGVGVDVEDPQPPLVARLDRDEQTAVGPVDVGEVLEAGPIPLDVDDAAVESDEVEGDVGVGRAGTGIGQLGRLGRRVGGIGEVPALDGPGVDASDGEALAVGTPPVPAEAVHLLGGDEVGAAPRDRFGLVGLAAGEHPPAPVELADAEQPAADVGDAAGGRVGPGIEHGAGDGELA